MKVYIVFNPFSEEIEEVFALEKDADDMIKSHGLTDRLIIEREVIE